MTMTKEQIRDTVKGKGEHAYCEYIRKSKKEACLGYEQKLKDGVFGATELKAHEDAEREYGKHVAYMDTLKQIDDLIAHIEDLEWEIKEGDGWQERLTDWIENGNCPYCRACDEEGHKDGCEMDELEQKLASLQAVADAAGDIPFAQLFDIIYDYGEEYGKEIVEVKKKLIALQQALAGVGRQDENNG